MSAGKLAAVPLTGGEAYPNATPYNEQTLAVSDIHTIYFSQSGNPEGKPVVFIHGGPGVGTSAKDTVYFDPAVYRIVLVDQRGAGKSTPAGELRENTTWDLVADLERVREVIGVDKWLVFGGSWGSTLALAYAETHPDRTAGLILRGVYLSRKSELDFSYQDGASHIFPEEWDKFYSHIPEDERHDMMGAYYRRLLRDDDESLVTAKIWDQWEDSIAKLIPDPVLIARTEEDPRFARTLARIEAHYFVNLGFMSDGYLVAEEQISKVRHIPTIVVQGRYDIVCPAVAAYDLKKAWGDSLRMYIVDDAGHSAQEPGTRRLLVGAANEFGSTLQW
ncbi:hypothetical protein VHUM_02093 [Vanrija humicola]|uniref:Proline iminopeptidase n=1 Tax=Vanrija humicola TaxID=5417 RepID=A0A7D8V5S2_VANHU|nr:hypothetical protein VHUM_02093 [Vanrija humicola]